MQQIHKANRIQIPRQTETGILCSRLGPLPNQKYKKVGNRTKKGSPFILNDYESQTPGCATKMVSDLKLEPLAVRRKTRRLSILNQTRLGHLSLPLDDFLQPIQRQSRHTHRLAYTQISTSKDCYKYSYLPRTINDWNLLPEQIVTNQKSTESFKNQVTKHLTQVNQNTTSKNNTHAQSFIPDRMTPHRSVGQYIN